MTPEEESLARLAKLKEWHESLMAATKVKPVIEAEQALRKEVFAMFFPAPTEGTNTYELPESWKLKGTYKIDRKIDEAALEAVKSKLREMNVNPDPLVVMKPSLDTKAYKSLHALNEEAGKIFDEALTLKPGSPTLELIPPKAT